MPRTQSYLIIEGKVESLTDKENSDYWLGLPRERQIRFYAYAPTSMQLIDRKAMLEEKKLLIEQEYKEKSLPVSPFYCGFRLKPIRIMFYASRSDELSDVFEYRKVNAGWTKQWLSP